jgi:hypothetical protein
VFVGSNADIPPVLFWDLWFKGVQGLAVAHIEKTAVDLIRGRDYWNTHWQEGMQWKAIHNNSKQY